jgi:hypothetical protein
MTTFLRFLALGVLVGFVAWISTPTQGEPTLITSRPFQPAVPPAPPKSPESDLADSKFADAPVVAYQPREGDALIGFQLKPALSAVPVRQRDYVIIISTSAVQAGEGWIGSTQIADGIAQTARDGDRISVWAASTPDQGFAGCES